MADDIQPELDAETLRKIEEEVQAQFAEHEPVLDEKTLKQIEAQVAAEFDSGPTPAAPQEFSQDPTSEALAPPVNQTLPVAQEAQPAPVEFDPNATTADEPIQELHQQPTALDMPIGMEAQAPQFEQPVQEQPPQLSAQSMPTQAQTYEQPQAFEQPQLQQTQYEQPQAFEQPQVYEQAAQEQYYEEPAPAPVTPPPPIPKSKPSGPKKKKLKGGAKTRVNMSGAAKGPSSRSGSRRTRVEVEEELEEEIPSRTTRVGARRTGRRKIAEEEPKKSKTGLIIGIIVGVAAIAAVVIYLVVDGKDKDKTAENEPVKEEVAEKKEEPKKPVERLPSTGALNTQDFRTQVLAMITRGQLEKAELYIKARKKDAPNEDLSYLEKRLKREQGN